MDKEIKSRLCLGGEGNKNIAAPYTTDIIQNWIGRVSGVRGWVIGMASSPSMRCTFRGTHKIPIPPAWLMVVLDFTLGVPMN